METTYGALGNFSTGSPAVIGPDLCTVEDVPGENKLAYLERFAANASLAKARVDALSYHHYYVSGATCKVQDLLSPSVLDQLYTLEHKVDAIRREHLPNSQMWLGETASAYGGGARNISDRFVSLFWYADQLGYAALRG